MGRGLLTSIGRITLSFIISVFILSKLYAAEADIKTGLSPSRIALGESAALTVTVSGRSSITPVKIPAINGLKITYTGTSHSFQFVNGKTWSGSVLNFSIYGEKTGEYKIPPFLFNTSSGQISSEGKTLIVQKSSSKGDNSIPISGEVTLSDRTVYVGEPLIMRYFLYNDNLDKIKVLGLADLPLAKDFSIKALNETIDKIDKIYVASFYIVPLKKGDYNIGENSIHVQTEESNGLFLRSVKKIVPCSGRRISVLPIPEKGKSDNFTGDVGEYKIEVYAPTGEFKQFEEIKIPVKIIGKGNLLTLSKPQVENKPEDHIEQKIIIEEKEANFSVNESGLDGEKEYLITIMPQDAGEFNLSKIFIEYFNPYKKSYERAESQPLAFNILPADRSSEIDEMNLNSNSTIGSFNLFWLFLFIIVLAVFIIALILWEKKKLNIIKSEIKSDAAEEKPVTENKRDNLLYDLEVSFNNKDIDLFFLNADRAINRINTLKLSNAELDRYKQYKESIYNCRYGGSVLEEKDMKELVDWFKGIKKFFD